MGITEAPLQEWACDQAEAAGWLHRKVKWVGRRNAPDDVFAKDGRTVWIEFKRPGGQPRPGQVREIDRMKGAGMEVHVVDNPLIALRILGVAYA
jgi:hypothetical protein